MLKLARPETKIIACEPENAALLNGKEWKPHAVQGKKNDAFVKVHFPNRLDTKFHP